MQSRRKSPPYLHSQDFWCFHNRFRKFVFDFSLYYLFGQKFWFWQTFWKVVFAIFIRTRRGWIFCPSIIYLDRNSILTNFFEKFLRSPQLHSQKKSGISEPDSEIFTFYLHSQAFTPRTSFSLLTASQYLPLHLIATEIKKVKAFCAVLKFCLQLPLT